MSKRRGIWAKLRPKGKNIEIRRGKRYRTLFIPRPDPALRDEVESSFTEPRPKE